MAGFFKKLFMSSSSDENDNYTKICENKSAVNSSINNFQQEYAHSENYNRSLYDSKKAKDTFKNETFGNKQTIRDDNGVLLHKCKITIK